MITKLCFFLVLISSSQLIARTASDSLTITSLKTLRAMNGIDPAPYDKFWETWPLVTTRYRADNGEQRYIYANEIAYEAMREGALEFPDGSVFGKVAFLAEEDPKFPNSIEATNFTRLQLMVKDSKKFRKMDGWSYWLHVDGVRSASAEDSQNALACHACHTLVKERDFIFAGPTFMGDVATMYATKGARFEDRFRVRKRAELNEYEKNVLTLLPEKPNQVKSLRMRLFSGSLHESIGPLARFSQDRSAYLLADPIQKRFLVAQPLSATKDCKSRALIIMDRPKTKIVNGKKQRSKLVSRGIVCDGKNKWVKSSAMPKELL